MKLCGLAILLVVFCVFLPILINCIKENYGAEFSHPQVSIPESFFRDFEEGLQYGLGDQEGQVEFPLLCGMAQIWGWLAP